MGSFFGFSRGDGERMREISREEHELILNLFIMEIAKYGADSLNIKTYKLLSKIDPYFIVLKDCFPMDEVCEQELFSNNRECYYKAINWIKEV